jgi:hypothetical protein
MVRGITTQTTTIRVCTAGNISRLVYSDRFVSCLQLRRLLNCSAIRVGREDDRERLSREDQMEVVVVYFQVLAYSLPGGTKEN